MKEKGIFIKKFKIHFLQNSYKNLRFCDNSSKLS